MGGVMSNEVLCCINGTQNVCHLDLQKTQQNKLLFWSNPLLLFNDFFRVHVEVEFNQNLDDLQMNHSMFLVMWIVVEFENHN